MYTSPLELVCQDKPELREKLSATLKTVAPHLTLESIGGDAQAIYGLLALTKNQKPITGPLCSIRF